MSEQNTTPATDAAATPLQLTAVEVPATRTGSFPVTVEIEVTSLAGDVPSAENVAAALSSLARGQAVYVARDGAGYLSSNTRVTVKSVTAL